MTSGQETERVHSYNLGTHTGHNCSLKIKWVTPVERKNYVTTALITSRSQPTSMQHSSHMLMS